MTAMLRAIETVYKGYRFRSRLEARWAVFFDALRFNWQYEPEGFVLPSGKLYLPDFRVMMLGEATWFEIKPGDEAENDLFTEFMMALPEGSRGSVLNDIPDPQYVKSTCGDEYYSDYPEVRPCVWFSGRQGMGDNGYRFCICEACDEAGFEYDGRSARIGCGCAIHKDCDRAHTADHLKIIAAFAKARAARFEHDEREVYR